MIFQIMMMMRDAEAHEINKRGVEGVEGVVCPVYKWNTSEDQKAERTAAVKTFFHFMEEQNFSSKYLARLRSKPWLVVLLFAYVDMNSVPRSTVQSSQKGLFTVVFPPKNMLMCSIAIASPKTGTGEFAADVLDADPAPFTQVLKGTPAGIKDPFEALDLPTVNFKRVIGNVKGPDSSDGDESDSDDEEEPDMLSSIIGRGPSGKGPVISFENLEQLIDVDAATAPWDVE